MTDPTEAIRKALESFDGGSLLIPVEQLRALLDRLDSAEAEVLEQARLNGMGAEREAALLARLDSAECDQRRYQWLRGNVGELSTSAFEDMQFYGAPDDLQDAIRLDAAIDAALRVGAVGGE